MEGVNELEPTRESALVDLLDRILVKGVVLHADIIISVADIPLIGVNLRAAIAGIKTMLDYGIMEAWDARIRSYAFENLEQGTLDLETGEELIYTTFASLSRGGMPTSLSRKGYLYLTNKRLILLRKRSETVLLELRLRQLDKVYLKRETYRGKNRKILSLTCRNDSKEEKEVKILSDDIDELALKINGMIVPVPTSPRQQVKRIIN